MLVPNAIYSKLPLSAKRAVKKAISKIGKKRKIRSNYRRSSRY